MIQLTADFFCIEREGGLFYHYQTSMYHGKETFMQKITESQLLCSVFKEFLIISCSHSLFLLFIILQATWRGDPLAKNRLLVT